MAALVGEEQPVDLHHGHTILDGQIELQHQHVEVSVLERHQRSVAVGHFDDGGMLRFDERSNDMADVAPLVGEQHAPARPGRDRYDVGGHHRRIITRTVGRANAKSRIAEPAACPGVWC